VLAGTCGWFLASGENAIRAGGRAEVLRESRGEGAKA
jgi:hypothetical protein